jgi:hypothetical protein
MPGSLAGDEPMKYPAPAALVEKVEEYCVKGDNWLKDAAPLPAAPYNSAV